MAASAVTITNVEQVGSSALRVAWTADADAGTMWQVNLNLGAGWLVWLDTLEVAARELLVPLYLDDGDEVAGVRIDAEPEGVSGSWAAVPIEWANPYEEARFTYGEPAVSASTIRYTTLDRVKARLNISGTEWDTELTSAIITAEVALDLNLGRSFPDAGVNPQYPFIPEPIRQAATNVAVAVAKSTDAPFGQSSSSDLYGELETADVVRREIQRSPVLVGFRVRTGFSGYGRLPS